MSPRCTSIISLCSAILLLASARTSDGHTQATTHSRGDGSALMGWTQPMTVLSRALRHSEGAQDTACQPFIEGNPERQEFYSPGWPDPYPNKTDCVLILEAPAGYLLRLDFRDEFYLEPSADCRFDYLEVRDGAHGYCNSLGHFCGREFPPMITSSDRYLWLRFHSDDNIEYKGFKAVYEFIPRPTSSSFTPEVDTCQMDIGGDEGIFGSSDIPEERLQMVESYNMAIDCMWVITVKDGWKIQMSFPEFKLDKPNDCDSNFVDVFSDRTDLPSRQKNFCGSIADAVTSKNNVVFVRFYAEARAIKSRFKAIFTAFREKKGGEACADDEWDCEDATCISRTLRCNGINNCRFRWDEDECVSNKKRVWDSEHIVIILVIFSLIISAMAFTFIFKCIQKLVKDHQTIQENIRQSREQQLNVLGEKAEIAQIVATVKKQMSRSSSSIQSSGSHRFESTLRDPNHCYVPGEVLPILVQNHNSATVATPSCVSECEQQPEMCDSACQTRESLFSACREVITQLPPSPPAPFSTFGYKKDERKNERDRYRAEAKIQVEGLEGSKSKSPRPYSVQTTKSAPDVIVTH